MNIKYFLKTYCPMRCGVHEAFGEVAWMIFQAELKEDKFPAKRFLNPWDRIKLAMPYKPAEGKEDEYERLQNVCGIIYFKHRHIKHGDKFKKDYELLIESTEMLEGEKALIDGDVAKEDDWWLA